MDVQPITVRHRLQDYEFTDEQEMTLTLELLNRIEKDIEALRDKKTRDGFSLYVALAGIAGTLYLLLGELSKLADISFTKISMAFFTGLLLLKIPWAFYQLIAFDQATKKRHTQGRFFWSNDFFFETRPAAILQLLVFLISLSLIFFLPMPLWVAVFTGISFLLYIFIIGLVSILSLRKEPYAPNNNNKNAAIGLPILFLIFTFASIGGLIRYMNAPIGSETQPYLIAGLLLTLVFFIDTLIRLLTPSLLLEKLQKLRYDIIFLRANLEDAWTRYEVYVDGHDISEELRGDMDDIIRCFNTLDAHQSQQEESLSAVQEELKQLEVMQSQRKLTQDDFSKLNEHKAKFFLHADEIGRIFGNLNPQLESIANQINRISRTTQEWQRAEIYHQYILSRLSSLTEKDKQIMEGGKDADGKLEKLQPKLKSIAK